jgi:hypothetical protein
VMSTAGSRNVLKLTPPLPSRSSTLTGSKSEIRSYCGRPHPRHRNVLAAQCPSVDVVELSARETANGVGAVTGVFEGHGLRNHESQEGMTSRPHCIDRKDQHAPRRLFDRGCTGRSRRACCARSRSRAAYATTARKDAPTRIVLPINATTNIIFGARSLRHR